MKVILNDDVSNLGEIGDIVDVKRGYARNFLIPQGKAVICSKSTLAELESKKSFIAKRKEEKRKNALSEKDKLEALSLVLKVATGDTGKLFGSVNNANVADELMKLGFNIERKKIELSEHTIKMVGDYTAKIKLYEDTIAEVKFSIVSENAKKNEKKADAVEKEEQEVKQEEAKEETKEENAAEISE